MVSNALLLCLQVNAIGKANVQEAVHDAFVRKKDLHAAACSKCQATTSMTSTDLVKSPRVMLIRLVRYK